MGPNSEVALIMIFFAPKQTMVAADLAILGTITENPPLLYLRQILTILSAAKYDAWVKGGGQEASGPPGLAVFQQNGCGGCHTIQGVQSATGKVGPPLARIARRAYLGGVLPNTRENMLRWIQTPQEFEPGSAMPNLGISEAEARDIVAYLYSR